MTQPNRFARDVEATSALAPVAPRPSSPTLLSASGPIDEELAAALQAATLRPIGEPYGADAKLAAALEVGAPAVLASSPAFEPVPAPDPAWTTANLSADAATLHSLACACDWGGDVEGHGVDFEDLAAAWSARVLGRAVAAGEVVPIEDVPARYPVEAKVSVGGWSSLAVGVGLALANLLLARLDMIPSLLGGDSPWIGALVLVLGAVLPAVIGTLRAYGAPHSPRLPVRPASGAQEGPAPAGA